MNKAPFLLLAMLLTACAATPVEYEIHQDATADFSHYRTFRLESQAGVSDPMLPRLGEARRLIEQAIVAELERKGYRRVTDQADFSVDYVVYTKDRFQQGGHDRYVFGDRIRVASGTEAQLANPIALGTLHVHLMDAAANRPVFEAIATGVVAPNEDFRPRIAPAVKRLLQDIPPVRD